MSKETKKTITCYNCGSQCEVIKCSLCNLEEWQCSCGCGFGHSHLSDITSNGQSLKEIKKEVDITKLQNQKAIECLMEVKKNCEKVGKFGFLTILTDEEFDETYIGEYVDHLRIKEIIDNKIKELEEEE